MKKKLIIGLFVAIVFQFFVLTGMYVNAALPLWTGKEVKIKTIPVDPRSMFRGNYALLRYDISQLSTDLLPESDDLRNGEVIYIVLKSGKNDLYKFSKAVLNKPESGIFLRGRIENRHYEKKAKYFRLKYGIEAFFAPKDKALALQNNLRKNGVAILMVSDDGKARLKDVTPIIKN